MKFKLLPKRLRSQANNILNKNERLATNIVAPTPSSVFDRSHRHLTTFNSQLLVPIYADEILPGDIHKINVNTLIRLSTPAAATMENPVYDIHFYFVPNRITWDKWKYFMGENKDAGYQKKYHSVPYILYDKEFKYNENDLATYLGIPCNRNFSNVRLGINSLYFKAYGKIWNDYYRDQNLQSEIDITNNNKNDELFVKVSEHDVPEYQKSIQIGKGLAPVSRLADYFSTCLPYPQKGESVSIDTLPLQNLRLNIPSQRVSSSFYSSPQTGLRTGPLVPVNSDGTRLVIGNEINKYYNLAYGGDRQNSQFIRAIQDTFYTKNPDQVKDLNFYLNTDPLSNGGSITSTTPFMYTVNDLRLSLAIQHMRELDARSGTRYNEMLLAHFGVKASDSRLDRAEFIGGFRDNINISNVVQSSNGPNSSPLGVLGGVSVSAGRNPRVIEYAAKEHGIIMGFVIVRPQINYSQGLERKFTRLQKLDYYDPLLANIGEQPVYKYELYVDDVNPDKNKEIFGYNEAWADLRYSLNKLSGFMNVNSVSSLASLYAYTEKYANAPVLGSEWMSSSGQVIGNTLLLNDGYIEYINQFLADFYFNVISERKMPVYSIPGLRKI